MKVKLKTLVLLILVVVVPTSLLAWGGWLLARQQSRQIELQVRDLFRDQLNELNSRIARYFESQEAKLQDVSISDLSNIESIREWVDARGSIENLFILSPNNTLVYPNPISTLNTRELEYYAKIKPIVEDGDIWNQVQKQSSQSTRNRVATPNVPGQPVFAPNADAVGNRQQVNKRGGQSNQSLDQSQKLQTGQSAQQSGLPAQAGVEQQAEANDGATIISSEDGLQSQEYLFGWFSWYWGRGVNLIFWQRMSNGSIVCISLERARWMSDLIGELPDASVYADYGASQTVFEESGRQHPRSMKLVNAGGDEVYIWGAKDPDGMVLAAEVPVCPPLSAWHLQMWVMPVELNAQSAVGMNILLGILAFAFALTAVAWTFFREYQKELREASKRVSFVNQVSHELRTPLTNIRMYAEILRKDLEDPQHIDEQQARKRIDIVEAESQRLSRLISNVLTFSGSQRNRMRLRRQPGVVDECIELILARFGPQLEKLQLRIETDLNAKDLVLFDPDALDQIVGNLISNVEKYAKTGKFIRVETRHLDDGYTDVVVADDGPGIDSRHAAHVFEPFYRVSNDLQDVSGTGIGLSISRDLARLHGGDLTLEASDSGCRFRVHLQTIKFNKENES